MKDFLSLVVERETSDFAALFSFEGVVGMVFGSCSYKFDDVVYFI